MIMTARHEMSLSQESLNKSVQQERVFLLDNAHAKDSREAACEFLFV
jgi:hypothetical protein